MERIGNVLSCKPPIGTVKTVGRVIEAGQHKQDNLKTREEAPYDFASHIRLTESQSSCWVVENLQSEFEGEEQYQKDKSISNKLSPAVFLDSY